MSRDARVENSAADSRVSVIAEIGVNHNGSVALAKKLITKAAEAGADYAKFQTFRATHLASPEASVARYQQVAFKGGQQIDLLAPLELSEDDFLSLVEHCESSGIGFLTTAHDLTSVPFVFSLRSDYIKVPSGDVTNFPFLRLVGQQQTEVLLSTGASTEKEVLDAILVLEGAGLSRRQITVMQCTSQYPAPAAEANLRAMGSMGRLWGVKIGYSDHTLGEETALAAVALGCTVLEKHITLDRNMSGPDHGASAEPDEFGRLVGSVRKIEMALGQDVKAVSPAEAQNRDLIRKSIVATRKIGEGDLFSEENVGVMRPGTGLSPMKWEKVIGQRALRTYERGEMVELP